MVSQSCGPLRKGQSPATDVAGGVPIGMGLVAACPAIKPIPALPVGAFAVPALGASLAGISGVHEDHGYIRESRLVADERAELGERPSREPILRVTAPSRDPVADALEVFEGDPASGAFGGLDDLLADDVVLVPAEPSLFTLDPPDLLLARFGVLALESFPLITPTTGLCRPEFAGWTRHPANRVWASRPDAA
jgi:hypothetical protein